jgi:hypothetical protein
MQKRDGLQSVQGFTPFVVSSVGHVLVGVSHCSQETQRLCGILWDTWTKKRGARSHVLDKSLVSLWASVSSSLGGW